MLADVERLLEKPIQNPARRPGSRRRLVGAFDLPKNLRLAQDHRLQSGSDPEQMPNRGNSLEPEKMLQLANCQRTVEIMKKRFDRQLRILGDNIKFCPVTGRQEHTFLDARELRESSQRIAQSGVRDGKSFADVDICRLMTDAEAENIHLKRRTVRDKSNPPERA